MTSVPFPEPVADEEDTQEYVYVVDDTPSSLGKAAESAANAVAALTREMDVPRASDFGRIAERLAKNPDADFWLPETPPIPMRIRLARTLRRLANYLERGGK